MCVIINKRKGEKLITKENLKKAFNHNSDGAGIAYTIGTPERPAHIILKKGFMKFESLWEYIEKLQRKFKDNDLLELSMIIHCRITTHGGTSPMNTHPFPLSKDSDDLIALSLKGLETVIAHNGVVSSVNVPKTSTFSDTMLFIKEQLYPISQLNKDWYRKEDVLKALNSIIGSKLSILNNQGEIFTVGEFHDYEGLQYSNLHWIASYGSYSYGRTYDRYNMYDDPYNSYIYDPYELDKSDYMTMVGEDIAKDLFDENNNPKVKSAYVADLDGKKDFYILEGFEGLIKFSKHKSTEYEVISPNDFGRKYKDVLFEVEIEEFDNDGCKVCLQ